MEGVNETEKFTYRFAGVIIKHNEGTTQRDEERFPADHATLKAVNIFCCDSHHCI